MIVASDDIRDALFERLQGVTSWAHSDQDDKDIQTDLPLPALQMRDGDESSTQSDEYPAIWTRAYEVFVSSTPAQARTIRDAIEAGMLYNASLVAPAGGIIRPQSGRRYTTLGGIAVKARMTNVMRALVEDTVAWVFMRCTIEVMTLGA